MESIRRAVLYARVPSDRRGASRSVESQCRAYIVRQGLTLVKVFVDKVKDNDRSASRPAGEPFPEYVQLRTFLMAGNRIDVLAYWAAGFAQRDLEGLGDLCRRHGIDMLSVPALLQ